VCTAKYASKEIAPMALSQSALSELLDAFGAGDGVDLIRESVRTVLQELIEAEAAEVIGARRYQRTDTRVTDRHGSRPRLLTIEAGDVALSIPKLRAGSFFPSVLEPRRRIDQALYAVVMKAYVHGVSTRVVDDLVVAMGGSGISKSEVSRICAGPEEAVGRPGPAAGPHRASVRVPACRLTPHTCTCAPTPPPAAAAGRSRPRPS
jgi:putative transposase